MPNEIINHVMGRLSEPYDVMLAATSYRFMILYYTVHKNHRDMKREDIINQLRCDLRRICALYNCNGCGETGWRRATITDGICEDCLPLTGICQECGVLNHKQFMCKSVKYDVYVCNKLTGGCRFECTICGVLMRDLENVRAYGACFKVVCCSCAQYFSHLSRFTSYCCVRHSDDKIRVGRTLLAAKCQNDPRREYVKCDVMKYFSRLVKHNINK